MTPQEMPQYARTIYPPYAWAIFHGLKWWETTTIRMHLRGRIAIHAAKTTPPRAALRFFERLETNQDSGKYTPEWLASLPHGVLLGTVELVDCIPVEQMRDTIPACERPFVDLSDGRFACKLANPILYPHPIPARGQQGWWKL